MENLKDVFVGLWALLGIILLLQAVSASYQEARKEFSGRSAVFGCLVLWIAILAAAYFLGGLVRGWL